MKKWLLVLMALLAIGLVFTGCPTDSDDDGEKSTVNWVKLPDDEIVYGVGYAGSGVYDAGTAVKQADGSYRVTIKYTAGNEKSQFAIGGPLGFGPDYSVTIDLDPLNDAVDKPSRLIVIPGPALPTDNDPQAGADWGKAFDTGASTEYNLSGTKIATNAGVGNNPDSVIHSLVIWLYFDQTKSGTYTFDIKEAKVGDTLLTATEAEAPPIVGAAAYLVPWAQQANITPAIAGMNYRIEKNFTAASGTNNIEIDIKFPDADVGKTYEFLVSASAYAGNTTNLLPAAQMTGAYVYAGSSETRQTSVSTADGTSGYYKIKAKVVDYETLFGANGKGIKLFLPFAAASGVTRYVLIFNFPKDYVTTP